MLQANAVNEARITIKTVVHRNCIPNFKFNGILAKAIDIFLFKQLAFESTMKFSYTDS